MYLTMLEWYLKLSEVISAKIEFYPFIQKLVPLSIAHIIGIMECHCPIVTTSDHYSVKTRLNVPYNICDSELNCNSLNKIVQ